MLFLTPSIYPVFSMKRMSFVFRWGEDILFFLLILRFLILGSKWGKGFTKKIRYNFY